MDLEHDFSLTLDFRQLYSVADQTAYMYGAR